jgi:hypothetical protein
MRCSSTLPSNSALDGVGVQRHVPAALPSGKTQYALYRRLGGPQGRSLGGCGKSRPTGIRSPDRPARSEPLYRLSYPGLLQQKVGRINPLRTGSTSVLTQFLGFRDDIPLCYRSSVIQHTTQTQQFIIRLNKQPFRKF